MSDLTSEVPTPSPENPFRSVKWMTEALSISRWTLYEWLREGKITGYKDTETNEWRVLHSDFVAFCQKRYGANG